MAKRPTGRISTLGSQFSSIVSVALVLLILGILAVLAVAGRNVSEQVRSGMSVIVKMHVDAAPSDVESLGASLASAPYAAEVTHQTADEVFAEELDGNEEILALIDENPFSDEFTVMLTPAYVNSDSIRAIAAAIASHGYVDEVLSQTDAVDNLNAAIHRISLILILVAVALLLISIVLIGNTVNISIYGRRFVIHTMTLVGATAGFIRRPFLRAAMISGVAAAIIATAILALIRWQLSTSDFGYIFAVDWSAIAIIGVALLAVGIIICTLSAWVATNRYLRASYDYLNKI